MDWRQERSCERLTQENADEKDAETGRREKIGAQDALPRTCFPHPSVCESLCDSHGLHFFFASRFSSLRSIPLPPVDPHVLFMGYHFSAAIRGGRAQGETLCTCDVLATYLSLCV